MKLVSFLSISIEGMARLFCVYAAVRMVCTEKGRRSISFLQFVVMMLAECIGIHSGWMEEQQLSDFMILLMIFLMIWLKIILGDHLCSPWIISMHTRTH
jgi:hypothetical protein